jgi:hypothetical protein
MLSVLDLGNYDCVQVNNKNEFVKLLMILAKLGNNPYNDIHYMNYLMSLDINRIVYFNVKLCGYTYSPRFLYQLSDIKEYVGYSNNINNNLKEILK